MSKVVVANPKEKESIGEVVLTIFYALLIALVIRTVLVEPFNIPSGSMTPTLLTGDYVFVSKFSYGYSKYSLPFAPDFLHGRLFGSLPKRGDVAVFINPCTGDDYIKRIVGLPGDKIQVKEGVLIINGEPAKRERIGDYTEHEVDDQYYMSVNDLRYRYIETLPNGVKHEILGDPVSQPEDSGQVDNTGVYEVPADSFFAMGDNRDNSQDSRFQPFKPCVGEPAKNPADRPHALGYVPVENLVGRADRRFISLEAGVHLWEVWKWPWALRVSRFFGPIN
jgi:signal peptidase I